MITEHVHDDFRYGSTATAGALWFSDDSPSVTQIGRRSNDCHQLLVQIARVHGASVNQLIIDSLATEIDCVRSDADFMSRARRLLELYQEIIDRLAE